MRSVRRRNDAVWWQRLLQRRRRERDLAEELESYLAHETADQAARGLTEADARRAAHRQLGNTTRIRETAREATRHFSHIQFVESVWHDIVHAIRALRRQPGFTLVAVLTLAVGIGLNVAVFSIVDRLMFRPLPYSDPQRLVQIHSQVSTDEQTRAALMPYEVTEAISRGTSFEGLGWVNGAGFATVPVAGENPLYLVETTWNILDVLGIRPVVGRNFDKLDEAADAESVVLLSYDAWRAGFHGSDAVLSTTWKRLNTTYRVIGVLPQGFLLPSSRFHERIDGLVVVQPKYFERAGHFTVAPFARLRPGISRATAQAEVDVLLRQQAWRSDFMRKGAESGRFRVSVMPLQSGLSVVVSPYLWLISGSLWVVLCVACVNLSTLLLMRGRARVRDWAVRLSLGATPARLVRLATAEALILSVAGALIALAACAWAEAGVVRLSPPTLRGFAVSPFDARIVGITVAVAVLTALCASVAPALVLSRTDPLTALRAHASQRSRLAFLRRGAPFVTIQAALVITVVVSAATAVPPFVGFLVRPPGFEPRDLFAMRVNHSWREEDQREDSDRAKRVDTILQVLRELPHVRHAAAALSSPFTDGANLSGVWDQFGAKGDLSAVSADVFETMRVPVLYGRTLTDEDVHDRAAVAVLNERGVRTIWPRQPAASAIGRKVTFDGVQRIVVGVVGDVRTRPGGEARPRAFVPITAREIRQTESALQVLLRVTPDTIPDAGLVTARLNAQFPRNSVRIQPVSALFEPLVEKPRLLAALLGTLGVVVLLLAAVGLYAVTRSEVTQRRYEIGLRVALGASERRVRWFVMRFALYPVVIGAAAGTLTTWLSWSTFAAFLPGVAAPSLAAYVLAVAVLISTAMATALSSAVRAGRTDPAVTLRSP